MTTERTAQTIRLADALAPPLSIVDGFASWTPEQWEAHDARIAEQQAREEQAELIATARRRVDELLKAGFPRRAVEASSVADEARAVVARIAAWSSGGSGGSGGSGDSGERSILVISGPAGCGKTVAATWWAARQRPAPRFLRATTFAASSRYDRDMRAEWFAASALVLDDLGSEYVDAKGSFLTDLDELIDVFYGDRKPLVVTTNCQLKKFRQRYGVRVVDRIRECGVFWSTADGSLRGAP